MENEQLLKKVIDTVEENSDAHIIASLKNGQVALSMGGKDSDLSHMIEGIGASYINSVLGDVDGNTVSDELDKLLDDLGLGDFDEEAN